MKNRILFTFSCFILSASGLLAQQDSLYTLQNKITGDIADFRVDNLGNIYLLSSDNQLKKLSQNGDSLAVFNDVKRYGKIYSIDVTNPLKILVYYREFGTIVMLDRFLNKINVIDLRNQNIFQAKAIGLGYDNNVWVYDELEAKLKSFRDDGTEANETSDIRQLIDSVPDPVYLADQSGFVYLCDSTHGIYVFDHYGAFVKYIPFPGKQDFSVIDKVLLGRDSNYFYRYQAGMFNILQQPIPAGYLPAIKILILSSGIYVLKTGVLETYKR